MKWRAARKWAWRTALCLLSVGSIVYGAYFALYQRPWDRYTALYLEDQDHSVDEVRARLHAILRPPIFGGHDPFLDAQRVGDWTTVPLLIGCLRWQEETDPGEPMICTKAHCLSSLRAITGHDAGTNYGDWRDWWRAKGKMLEPESRAPTMNLMQSIAISDRIYRQKTESMPPNDPLALIETLCGANEESEAYFRLAAGEVPEDLLIDQWGSAFRFTRSDVNQLIVTSGGPDMIFGTADDLPPKRPPTKD